MANWRSDKERGVTAIYKDDKEILKFLAKRNQRQMVVELRMLLRDACLATGNSPDDLGGEATERFCSDLKIDTFEILGDLENSLDTPG